MRVMLAESAGNPRVVSPKGAMGCMQIMPATWSYLSSRYALGADPFDARMNMIGGAMYLAELAARYGFPGAFAAYNAGPGRYQRYAAGRAALPAETVAYTARIGRVGPDKPMAAGLPPRWQDARLFIVRANPSEAAGAPTATDPPSRGVSGVLFPLTGRDGVGTASSVGP
jgi:hypothetical protein